MPLFRDLPLHEQLHRSVSQLLYSPDKWFGYANCNRTVVADLVKLGIAEIDQTRAGMFIKLLDEPKGRKWIAVNG